jgi:hypothetical protein
MVFTPRQFQTGPAARRYGPALGLGAHLTAGLLAFTFLGRLIDRRRGGGDLFTLCGIFLGLAYGGYEVWKVVRGLQREETDAGRSPRDERRD